MRKTIKYKRKGKRKTKGGKALRNPILSIPKNGIEMIEKGRSKTVWQLKGRPYAVINANVKQMTETTFEKQQEEYQFSKILSIKYPSLFPKVYHLDIDEETKEESDVLDTLPLEETELKPNTKYKFIWAKEVCNIPSIEELRGNYLEKVIQILITLMEKGLCYTDMKPMNVGIRGNNYVIIDTSHEDIYYVPPDYQLDYLKGEILVSCMTLYLYVSLSQDEKNKPFWLPPDVLNHPILLKIKRIFAFLFINKALERDAFIAKLKQFLLTKETYSVPYEELIHYIKKLTRNISGSYNCTDEEGCIFNDFYSFQKQIPCEGQICKTEDIVSIVSSFRTYLSTEKINHFFAELKSIYGSENLTETSLWNRFRLY